MRYVSLSNMVEEFWRSSSILDGSWGMFKILREVPSYPEKWGYSRRNELCFL